MCQLTNDNYKENYKNNIDILLNNDIIGLISKKNVFLFYQFIKLFRERFTLLNKI